MSTEEQNIAEYKRTIFKMLDEIRDVIDTEMSTYILRKWYLDVRWIYNYRYGR